MNETGWPPIEADDETLKAALAEASIPALMAALVHITGDRSIVEGEIRPQPNVLADAQAGITPAQQEEARRLAFDKIVQFRDSGSRLPSGPDEATIQSMINFMTGLELDSDYVGFLRSELALDGEGAFVLPDFSDVAPDRLADFSVLVIGAGMSGILAAIQLKKAGIAFTVVEKNAEVGGTWYENTYPGCRVDSPNHTYSYSFAPRDWPQYFSSQPVLLDYFKSVVSEFGIRDQIEFNTEVIEATYDEQQGKWHITVQADGKQRTLSANAVISAVGQLNRPRLPDIEGRDTFAGPSFHSGHWEHEHDLTDKKIIVIGTGASAFQFVPVIAEVARDITVFQRTPPWVAQRPEYHDAIPEGKHWLLNHLPYYSAWYRFFTFWRTSEGMLPAAKRDRAWNEPGSVSRENQVVRDMLTAGAKAVIGEDEALLELVIPDYPPAGKRMLIDNGTWYRTLRGPGVKIVADPVARITPTGVVTANGDRYDADVLIYGTGFQASNFLAPMRIVGRSGIEIHEHWRNDPRAYMGMTIPNYPNFFCLYGPNTNLVVNGSIIFFSECEMRYIMGCLKTLLAGGHKAMEPRQEVHDAYNERIDAGNLERAWGSEDVNSWYKNEDGRVTQNWPFSLREFWDQTRAPNPQDFEFS